LTRGIASSKAMVDGVEDDIFDSDLSQKSRLLFAAEGE
jgi:hypothetical protein